MCYIPAVFTLLRCILNWVVIPVPWAPSLPSREIFRRSLADLHGTGKVELASASYHRHLIDKKISLKSAIVSASHSAINLSPMESGALQNYILPSCCHFDPAAVDVSYCGIGTFAEPIL
jgi:hypothetical protein